MKRVVLTFEDDSTGTYILGTTREIQTLAKNLYKRFGYYYHYCNPPRLTGDNFRIWAICPEDGCVISGHDFIRWMHDAKAVEFT